MMGINEMGFEVFEEMLDYADDLQIEVHELDNGTVVADAGVEAHGGFGAGVYLSRLCMADLAEIQLTPFDIKGVLLPGIQVATDYPAISCMASQCAMWQIKADKYFAMGSEIGRASCRERVYVQV
jgi:methenyltetrahydromethanopterin cyclohydrolase